MNLLIWKSKKRVQPALVLTEDGRAVDEAFPVELGYLLPKNSDEAYLNCRAAMVPRRSDGVLTLIMDEREAAPLAINKKAADARDKFKIKDIAAEFFSQSLYNVWKRFKGETQAKVFQTLLLVGGIGTFGIFILMILFSGHFHWPTRG